MSCKSCKDLLDPWEDVLSISDLLFWKEDLLGGNSCSSQMITSCSNAFCNLVIQDSKKILAFPKNNFQQGQKSVLQLILQSLGYDSSPKKAERRSTSFRC